MQDFFGRNKEIVGTISGGISKENVERIVERNFVTMHVKITEGIDVGLLNDFFEEIPGKFH